MKSIIKSGRGDTIVEVLFSVVICSVILVGAYVTSNDSLLNIRDAQGRIQALGYAQNQAEDLRALSTVQQPSPTQLSGVQPFCFDSSEALTNFPSSGPNPCVFDLIYTVKIVGQGQTGNGITTYGFDITVTWPSLSPGATNDQLSLFYRVGI